MYVTYNRDPSERKYLSDHQIDNHIKYYVPLSEKKNQTPTFLEMLILSTKGPTKRIESFHLRWRRHDVCAPGRPFGPPTQHYISAKQQRHDRNPTETFDATARMKALHHSTPE